MLSCLFKCPAGFLFFFRISYVPDFMPIVRSLFCEIGYEVCSSSELFYSGQKKKKKGTKCYWERQGNKNIQKDTLVLPILSVSGWWVTECSSMIQYGKIFSPIVLMSIHVMLPIFFACYASYAQCTEYIRVSNIYISVRMCVDVHATHFICLVCVLSLHFQGLWSMWAMLGGATCQTVRDLK